MSDEHFGASEYDELYNPTDNILAQIRALRDKLASGETKNITAIRLSDITEDTGPVRETYQWYGTGDPMDLTTLPTGLLLASGGVDILGTTYYAVYLLAGVPTWWIDSVSGIVPHSTTHKHGGGDEVATATPAANAIPKADVSGTLNSWVTAGTPAAHAIDGTAHTIGGLTSGYMVKSDGSKVVPATNTDAQVAAAVTASHAKQHAITSTADHTSSATAGQMLKADANGLPVNATNTDAQVAAAVTASHAAVTILDGTTIDLGLTGQQITAEVKADSITNALLDNMTAESIKANPTASAVNPTDVTVAEQTLVGRITGGHVDDLSATTVRTLLNVADGATANAKASSAEIDTGTDDVKFATAAAISGSHNVPNVVPSTAGKVMTSDGTDWISSPPTGAAVADLTGTAETLGGSAVVGVATTASRSDHKHAITNPAIDTLASATDITTLNATTTAHGLLVKATAPAAGLVNVVGIANGETVYANKALFDATVPSTQASGDAAATGTATVTARRDHKHAMPGVSSTTAAGFAPQATAPAAALMNVPGIVNAETVLSMKPIFDGTAPTTIAAGDTAAAGTSLLAAHRDHVHGSPSAWAASAHNLLSTTHGDTLAASVADGSIIIGNVTPKWSTLAISVPAANLINVLGVVNGETRPSWKALLDAITPANLGVAAAGTATTASHRDHVHNMPAIDTLNAATDITTLNATTSAHGLVVKAVAPAANLMNVVGIVNGETAYTNKAIFDATNPAAVGTAAPGTATTAAHRDHVHGAAESAVTFTDITTNDASTTKHGYLLKATAPAAGELNVVGIANGETGYANKDIFDTTNPAAVGTAAPGTQIVAARRDHVHAMGNLTGDATSSGLATTLVQASSAFAFTGDISPTALTGNVDNWSPTGLSTASVIYVTSDVSGRAILGLAGGADGRIITLIEGSNNYFYINHEAGTSIAANRFFTPHSVTYYAAPRSITRLMYSAVDGRWHILGSVATISSDFPPTTLTANAAAATGSTTRPASVEHAHGTPDYWIPIMSYLANVTVAAGATVYVPLGVSMAPSSSAISNILPASCNFKYLRCRISTAQPAGGSLQVMLRNISAGTDLITLTIPLSSVAGTYAETSTSAIPSAGVLMALKFVNNAPAAASAQILSAAIGAHIFA
jgi:hypothetical protein